MIQPSPTKKKSHLLQGSASLSKYEDRTLEQQVSLQQYLPFFGVFQSNTSQAKYRAAIAQQSVHSIYMRIKVQAIPGEVQERRKQGCSRFWSPFTPLAF